METEPRPDEAAALRKLLRGQTHRVAAFVILGIGVCCFLAFQAVTNPDARQHFLGQSEKVRVTVVDESVNGHCRRRGPRTSYTVEWTDGGSRHSSHTVPRCSDPYDVGDAADVWRTDSATYTDSPMLRRSLTGGAFLFFGAGAVLAARGGDRLHRIVNAALSGEPMTGPFPAKGDVHTGSLHVQLRPADSMATQEIPKAKLLIETPGRARHSARAPRGSLWLSELRDGRPSGLMLFVGDDGSRVWRWIR